MNATSQPPITILRLKQLQARTGLGRSTIFDRANPRSPRHDPTFPKKIRLGAKAGTSAIGWSADDVQIWLEARIAASRSDEKH